MGFALYKKGGDLFILSVAYEYADTMFVGFNQNAEVFKIKKINDVQREWLKTHDPKSIKKPLIFVDNGYYLERVHFSDFPKGKPYTQLPGGGGVFKETRKYDFVNQLFKNETILKAIEKYGIFAEGRIVIKKIIKEAIDKIIGIEEYKNKRELGFNLLKKEANKYSTSEELLRSGGFSINALDLAAFGITEESVKTLMPNQLSIKWKDDIENVIFEFKKSGLSKEEWAKRIDLSEPIDVSFDGNKFYVEDGHHRLFAANILNKPLNVNLEIKANPILKLSKKGYDDFHRDFFNKFKKKKKDFLKQVIPSVAFTAVSIEKESEIKKINKIFSLLEKQGKIPSGLKRPTFKNGTLDYHMTIKLGELPLSLKRDLDKDVILNVESVGISDDAVALGIFGDYLSENNLQHITLAFKSYPADSRIIKNWEKLKVPFSIKGTIREFTPKKEIIKRGIFETPIDEVN